MKFDYLKKAEEKEDTPIKEALPGFFKREKFQSFFLVFSDNLLFLWFWLLQ